MYSVIAPAASCDDQQGNRTDNATQENKKNDLKLVSSSEAQTEAREEIPPLDPSEIAAKILQMHATADDIQAATTREPKLVDNQDDLSFEIPGVLLRPREADVYSGLQPEIVPKLAASASQPVAGRKKPRFAALICGALLAVAAGGATVVFGMPHLLGQDETGTSPVETKVIAEEPVVNNVVSESAAPTSVEQPSSTVAAVTADPIKQDSTQVAAATPQQIAKAKDRIRDAFATSGTSAPEPVTQTAPAVERPVNSLANQALARMERSQDTVTPATANRGPGDLPVLASTAKTVPIPQSLLPTTTSEPAPQVTETAPLASEVTPQVQEPQQPSIETAAASPADPDFPNTAVTSASVNLRQSEEKNATIIGVIPANTEVQFSECGKWWCAVSYDGKSGFVGQKYLERQAQAE